jgi:hypothetical protein
VQDKKTTNHFKKSIKHKEEIKMYRVYVDGYEVTAEPIELTESEVRNYNTLEGVTVKKA